jgi:hypothetical protein
MPDPADLPSGCKFHERCPKCFGPCPTQHPSAIKISETHTIRCHLFVSEVKKEAEALASGSSLREKG